MTRQTTQPLHAEIVIPTEVKEKKRNKKLEDNKSLNNEYYIHKDFIKDVICM